MNFEFKCPECNSIMNQENNLTITLDLNKPCNVFETLAEEMVALYHFVMKQKEKFILIDKQLNNRKNTHPLFS